MCKAICFNGRAKSKKLITFVTVICWPPISSFELLLIMDWPQPPAVDIARMTVSG